MMFWEPELCTTALIPKFEGVRVMLGLEIMIIIVSSVLEAGALALLLYDRNSSWRMAALVLPVYTLVMAPLNMLISTPRQKLPAVFFITLFISWVIFKKKQAIDAGLYSLLFLNAVYMGRIIAQAVLTQGESFNPASFPAVELMIMQAIMTLTAMLITYGLIMGFRKLFMDLVQEKNEKVTVWFLLALCFMLTDLWSIEAMMQEPYSVAGDFAPRIAVLAVIFVLFYIDRQQYFSMLVKQNTQSLLEQHRLYQAYAVVNREAESSIFFQNTGNTLFDTILLEKQKKCSELGIRMNCRGDFRYLDKLEPSDITLIMDGLLEYMMDVCRENRREEAEIEVIGKLKKVFYIQCKCPCGKSFLKREKPTERQQMKWSILECTARRYDGPVSAKNEDGMLTVMVRIDGDVLH